MVLTFAWLIGLALAPLSPWPTWSTVRGAAPFLLLAGVGEAAYLACLGRAYAEGDLAPTYAISRGTALIVIWPVAWLLFGEAPTMLAWLATLVVLGGVALARPTEGGTRWSVPWTLGTGLSVGVYHAGYDGAANLGIAPVLGFVAALTLACRARGCSVGDRRVGSRRSGARRRCAWSAASARSRSCS